MKKKISKLLSVIIFPVVAFLTLGVFVANSFVSGSVDALSNGGAFIAGQYSQITIGSKTTISGFSANLGGGAYVSKGGAISTSGSIFRNNAVNGGGIFVANGGTATLEGGVVSGNIATENGNNIYNSGTLNINSGTVGDPGTIVRVNAEGLEDKNGDYVLFGSYPQSIKASDVTIDENDFLSDSGYLGSDGNRYVKIVADPYANDYHFSDGTNIVKGQTYYFKREPIKWRILSLKNNEALLLAENILCRDWYYLNENRVIDGKNVYPNNYKHSFVRQRLESASDSGFFTLEEQTRILKTVVDNSVNTLATDAYNYYVCEDTYDDLFLLSYKDLVNPEYGFNENARYRDPMRRKTVSDFARAENVYTFVESGYNGYGLWMLRSPSPTDYNCFSYVNGYGSSYFYRRCDELFNGVVPAVRVLLDDEFSENEKSDWGVYNSGNLYLNGGKICDEIYVTKNDSLTNSMLSGGFYQYGGIVTKNIIGDANTYLEISGGDVGGVVSVGGQLSVRGGTIKDISCLSGSVTEITNVTVNGKITTNGLLTIDGGTFNGSGEKSFFCRSGSTTKINGGMINLYNELYCENGSKVYFYGGTSSGSITGEEGSIIYVYGGAISGSITTNGTVILGKDVNVSGTINLGKTGVVIFDEYDGTTQNLKINLTSSRSDEIVVFSGSSIMPNLSKLNVSGFDTRAYKLNVVQGSSSTIWNVVLRKIAVDFPSDWREQVFSSDYMTTIIYPQELTSILFETTIPSGYAHVGTLSTELKVFKDVSDSTKIAFVDERRIFAPEDSSFLFSISTLQTLSLNNFDSSNVTNMTGMFHGCTSFVSLDLSGLNMKNVTTATNMLHFLGRSASSLLRLKTPTNVKIDLDITSSYPLYYECEKVSKVPAGSSYLLYDQSKWFPKDWYSVVYQNLGLNVSEGKDYKFLEKLPENSGYEYAGTLSTGIKVYYISEISETTHYNEYKIAFVNEYGKIFLPEDSSGLFSSSHILAYRSVSFDNVCTNKTKNMSGMFRGVSCFESVDLSSFSTVNVTNMSEMFYGCLSLKKLDLSSFYIGNGVNVERMLDGCTLLEEIVCPNFVVVDISLPHTMYSYHYATNKISSTYAGSTLFKDSGKYFAQNKSNFLFGEADGFVVDDKVLAILSDEKKRLFVPKKKEIGEDEDFCWLISFG